MNINENKCYARINGIEQCSNDIYKYKLCKLHFDKDIEKINDFPSLNNLLDEINKYTNDIPQEKYIIYKNKPIKINKWDEEKYKNEASKTFITNYKNIYKNKSNDEILNEISGPAYLNPLLSTNNCDPISLEDIWYETDNVKRLTLEIDKRLLFSFKDDNNHIWCFNIKTLRRLFLQNKDDVVNPYTREKIPNDIIKNAQIKIEILEEEKVLDLIECDYDLNENKIIIMLENILCKLNNNNFIGIEKNWFLDLEKIRLKQFYDELKTIFIENIVFNCNLKDFYGIDISIDDIFSYNKNEFLLYEKIMVQYAILSTIIKLYKNDVTICHIIIRSFSFVSNEIKNLFPNISL